MGVDYSVFFVHNEKKRMGVDYSVFFVHNDN